MSATELLCSLRHVLNNQRARQCRNQRVLLHVETICLNGRQAVLLGEFILSVDNDSFDSAGVQSALTHGLHVLAALSDIDRNCDDLAVGHFLEVRNSNGGIEATRVSKNNPVGHRVSAPLIGALKHFVE